MPHWGQVPGAIDSTHNQENNLEGVGRRGNLLLAFFLEWGAADDAKTILGIDRFAHGALVIG